MWLYKQSALRHFTDRDLRAKYAFWHKYGTWYNTPLVHFYQTEICIYCIYFSQSVNTQNWPLSPYLHYIILLQFLSTALGCRSCSAHLSVAYLSKNKPQNSEKWINNIYIYIYMHLITYFYLQDNKWFGFRNIKKSDEITHQIRVK